MFLKRSKLSITVYLFLVLYRSTSLQSLSILKNIKTFLCKQKLVNNCSIPSTQQPYNHNSFSKKYQTFYSLTVMIVSQKISRTFYASGNQRIIIVFLQRMLKVIYEQSFCKKLFYSISLSQPLRTDGITDGETNTLAAHELEELFSSCAVVSVFGSGGKQVLVLHTTYVLRVQYSSGVVLVFWFWREKDFGVTYILSVRYSCAVVSVFWLWWEIVLKMRTRFYKKILLGYFIMICQPVCVFHKT